MVQGGGFLLTSFLLICFPTMSAQSVTAISVITVLFNTASGVCLYETHCYKKGIIYTIATFPGAIAGTILTGYASRELFNIIFGAFMLIFAVVIILKSRMSNRSAPIDAPGRLRAKRNLTDRDGNVTAFSL